MSVRFDFSQPNSSGTSYIHNQGLVERDPEALSAFFQDTFSNIVLSQDPERFIDVLDELDVPFKYQLLNLGIRPYIGVENRQETTEKIVQMLADKGYLYHASVLASSQVNIRRLIEPIRSSVARALRDDEDCREELRNIVNNFPMIDHIMNSLWQKDRLEELLALVPWVSNSENRDAWSKYLVKNLTLKAQIDEARAIIPQIGDDTDREEACIPIIKALMKAGSYEEALRLASGLQIQEVIDVANPLITRAAAISAFSKIGHIDRALELFSEISSEEEKSLAAEPLLRAMLDAGRVDEVMEILVRIEDHSTLCLIKRDLVEVLVQVDRLDDAEGLFLAISDENEQSEVGLPIVKRLIDIGRLEEARARVLGSTNTLFKDKGSVVVIKELLKESLLKEARAVFNGITDLNEQSFGALLIMEHLMKNNLIEETFEFFYDFQYLNPEILYPVLRDLIIALTKMGKKDIFDAIAIVDLCSDGHTKALLAVPILKTLVTKNMLQEAINCLANVSMRGRCLSPVKIELAEKLIRKNDRSSLSQANKILSQTQGAVSFYIPLIKAWYDIGQINSAVKLLKENLQKTDSQSCLAEVTAEILQELIERRDFREIDNINFLIVDEVLQEQVEPLLEIAEAQCMTRRVQSAGRTSQTSSSLCTIS